jgi:hypothetical protein
VTHTDTRLLHAHRLVADDRQAPHVLTVDHSGHGVASLVVRAHLIGSAHPPPALRRRTKASAFGCLPSERDHDVGD